LLAACLLRQPALHTQHELQLHLCCTALLPACCMQGYGGFMYSDDGGDSWHLFEQHPFHNSINSITVDPTGSCKLYYATGGAGVLHGPAPPGLPGC
jgi:hypothetical protein